VGCVVWGLGLGFGVVCLGFGVGGLGFGVWGLGTVRYIMSVRKSLDPPAEYRGDSNFRTHTALGPYGRSVPTSIGPA